MKNMKRKILKALKNPIATFVHVLGFERTAFIPDELYLHLTYKFYIGKKLNLKNPQTYNEKLQWLKLHNRKPIYTIMVDKVKVRDYVANKIGTQYLIPSLGVWDDPEKIDFDALPDQFVLKCNHNSGTGMCICKDKSKLDIAKVKANLRRGLDEDYFYYGREWPYKDVPRRILGEQYMEDSSSTDLKDYKLMCFGGKVRCSFVCSERKESLKVTFFDNNWERMPFERHYPASNVDIPKPKNFAKMIELAEILSNGIPFVRVDFYEINGRIYFGELTFYPGCGFEEFEPEEWDFKLGEWIRLPEKTNS